MNSSTCTICQMCFDSVLTKKVHEQQVHIFVFQCEYCETKFTSDENLKKHVAATCSEKLRKKRRKGGNNHVENIDRSLLSRENSDETGKDLARELESELKSKNSKKEHRSAKAKHARKEAKAVVAFECSECESLFKSEEALSKHENVHFNEKSELKGKHTNAEYNEALKKAELLPGLLEKQKILQTKLEKLKTKATPKINKVTKDTYETQSEYQEIGEKANNLGLLVQNEDSLQQNLSSKLEANAMKEKNNFLPADDKNDSENGKSKELSGSKISTS